MRHHLQRRWPWLTALLVAALVIQPSSAWGQPAGAAPALSAGQRAGDDNGGLPGRSRQCAFQQTFTTVNGGREERYAYRLCGVLRDPPAGQAGDADQQLHAELTVITDGGQIRAFNGELHLCRGRGATATRRDLGEICERRTLIQSRRASPDDADVTVPGNSLRVPCADPDSDAQPYFAALTGFRLLGSEGSGFEVDFSDRTRPAAAFGEITPTLTPAACTSDAGTTRPAAPDGVDLRTPCRRPDGAVNPLCSRSVTPGGSQDPPLIWRLV